LADFPSRPDAVTPAWLSEQLGLQVSDVTYEPIGTGQVGDSARFHLRYSGKQGPETLAAKFPAADETSRNTGAMMGLYRKEVGFYRQVAPQLDVRVPQVIASEIADDGVEFILLFEDLGPARGGNQLAGCSLADAEAAIRQAAMIHAPSWNNSAIVDLQLLQPLPGLTEQIRAMYPQAHAVFAERYANTLEPEFMDVCHQLNEANREWFERHDGDRCLVHGDFRLDNMLFEIRGGTEPIAILDWQTTTVGHAMTDIGYFLGCGIGNELRQSHGDHLLDLYCAEMGARGVPLTRDDIQFAFRLGALHGVSTAVFSAAFVERTERGDANFLSMARGACGLALAQNSIAALKEAA